MSTLEKSIFICGNLLTVRGGGHYFPFFFIQAQPFPMCPWPGYFFAPASRAHDLEGNPSKLPGGSKNLLWLQGKQAQNPIPHNCGYDQDILLKNNDILRSIRYTLKLSDSKMTSIFVLADYHVTREQVCNWLKKDEDPAFQDCSDTQLALFLNGLINDKRGKKEGPQPQAEKRLNNNIVLRKLKIAFHLQGEDIVEIMALSGLSISQHELSAFFRKPGHKHYRPCKDQILRNFLKGIQIKYRPESPILEETMLDWCTRSEND